MRFKYNNYFNLGVYIMLIFTTKGEIEESLLEKKLEMVIN